MDDPLVHCPFELSHTCKQSRLQKHLIKCRKNHPESKLEPCPYNATEYIHPDDLIEHLKVCKNAKLLEAQKYTAELHKENYLDAPFHLPKPQAEPEDFEGLEVSVNDTDERVLERSVSQMSLNSIASNESLGCHDKAIPSLKSLTPLNLQRSSVNLASRSSTLRSAGRGYAMANLMSVMHQMDGMDYSKYEIRSTVTDDKSEKIDPDFAHPSTLGYGSITLFDRINSKFEDCSSEEEQEDNVSVCSSKSTIIENNATNIENIRQSWAESPEPLKTVGVHSDSEDEEAYENDLKGCASVNSISVNREENQDVVSNEQDSSSSSSFFSLIRQNFLQNDWLVRGTERNEDRMPKFGRGRPGYHNQNRSFRNCGANYEQGAGQSQSVGGRGAALNAMLNPNAQSNRMDNDGQRYFNENGYQNYSNQGQHRQHTQSNHNNQGNHSNQKQKSYQNYVNQNQYPHRPYSNQNPNENYFMQRPYSNQSNHSNRSQNGCENYPKQNHDPNRSYSNQSNCGGYSNQNRGRGSASPGNSVGRGLKSFGTEDSYPPNSFGRGNLSERLGSGDASYQNNSVGRGQFHFSDKNNHSKRGSFNQENPSSRGNIHNQKNSYRNGSQFEDESVSRGNFRNHGNAVNRQSPYNQENSLGRGSLLNQVHSSGRGTYHNHGNQNQMLNQGKSVGRGSLLANSGNAEGPVGRGRLLAQFSNFKNNESVGRGQPITANHYGNAGNFRGKSSEIPQHSFEAVYKSFMDLEISDNSRIQSPTQKRVFTQVPSFGGVMSLSKSSPSLAQPGKSHVHSSAPEKSKSKTKKKKKAKETSSQSPVVSSCSKSDTNAGGLVQASSASSFKILDKSMDPKKYFGADGDKKTNSNEDNTKASSCQDKKVSSNESNSETNLKQEENKAKSKKLKKAKKAKKTISKQGSNVASSKQGNKEASLKENISNCDLKANDNVYQNASTRNHMKTTVNKKIAPVKHNDKFQVYDQFYSSMSFGPIHSQASANYNPNVQNKVNFQGSSSQPGRFNGRLEDVSVNCIRVSEKSVNSAGVSDISSSPSSVAFSSLHEPQSPRHPGRYDKLQGTGYKFMIRHTNKKQKVFNHKPKIVSQGKKSQKPPIVTSAAGVVSNQHTIDQDPKINNIPNVLLKTNGLHSEKNKPFQKKSTRSDMSLWNKKSYVKISPGDNSSHNPLRKPQMSQQVFKTPNTNNFQPDSYFRNSASDEYNLYPSQKSHLKASNSGFVKNAPPKKHSFVVLKEKVNHTQRKYSSKNQYFEHSRPRLRHPNGLNFLSLMPSNPFETPVAFGPSQSCHLNYSSHKPLARDPFRL